MTDTLAAAAPPGLPLLDSRRKSIFPTLTPAQIARIAPHGRVRQVERGEILLLLETSLPAVLAVGDVRCGNIKRVASAVGEGSIAIAFVHQVLHE